MTRMTQRQRLVSEAGRPAPKDGGGLTPLVYAVRSDDLDSVKALLAAGADINQVTDYGWSPLLVATQNRYYKLASVFCWTTAPT